jgi:hypothetical protein
MVRGIPYRVAHNVLHGASQQLLESVQRTGVGLLDGYASASRASFEIGIACNFLDQIGQIKRYRSASIQPTIDSGERQQLTDQRVQSPSFQPNPLQVLFGFFGRTLPHQTERHDQP